MFKIVTREDQISSTDTKNKVNQELLDKCKLYPGLLPYFMGISIFKGFKALFPIERVKEPGVALNHRIKYTIQALHSILTYVFNCKVITNTKTTIPYIVPYDRRIGVVAIDASKTYFPEPYKIPAKHRFDLDLILDAPTNKEALHHLYSYASQIAMWVNKFNFSENIVVYDEANTCYQELIIDSEVTESEAKSAKNFMHKYFVGLKYKDLNEHINASSYHKVFSFRTPDPVNKSIGATNALEL